MGTCMSTKSIRLVASVILSSNIRLVSSSGTHIELFFSFGLELGQRLFEGALSDALGGFATASGSVGHFTLAGAWGHHDVLVKRFSGF